MTLKEYVKQLIMQFPSIFPNALQIDWYGMPAHKWEPDEIVSDCKYVIDQLNGKD